MGESIAGNATGQNKYWFNIKNLDTRSFYSNDFNKVKKVEISSGSNSY